MLIIEDLVAVALLGILANSSIGDQYAMASAALKIIATFVVAYVALSHAIKWLLGLVEHSDELLLLFVVSIVLVISYLCQSIGLSFTVGSFLAGSVVAATPQARRIEDMLRPFNALFASFFFFSIGMLVDAHATLAAWPLLLVLLLVSVVGKFCASAIGAYLTGLSGTSASFAASSLLPLGELGLLIASGAAAAGVLPAGILGLLATVIVLTSLLSVALVGAERGVYNGVKSLIPDLLSRQMRTVRSTSVGMQRAVEENSRYSRIVSRLPSIGHGRVWGSSTHEQLQKALRNVAMFGVAAIVLGLILQLGAGPMHESLASVGLFVLIGFYVSGGLFIFNVSATLSTYISILTHAGREGLVWVMHLAGLGAFGVMGAATVLLVIWSGDWRFLLFLIPIVVLGLRHPWALVQKVRMLVFRYQ